MKMYKTIQDSSAVDWNLMNVNAFEGKEKEKAEIWYQKNFKPTAEYKKENLQETHVLLGVVDSVNKEDIFQTMQGEVWSPTGEAKDLILSKELRHTSMSVGDAIKIGNTVWYCKGMAWEKNKKGKGL